ncbi:MAG: glycosyltransferase family 4 protein [Pricia sp.]
MKAIPKKKVIVVDLSVKKTSPAGSCVLSELLGLAKLFDIHLFTTEFDKHLEEHVSVHRITAMRFPLLLRYILFKRQVNKKIAVFLKKNNDVAVIQTTQGQYDQSDIAYAHFCHKAYLQQHYGQSTAKGLTRVIRKLGHTFNARQEKKAFQNSKVIVVPSKGLGKEISTAYPSEGNKVRVIPNPINLDHFARPINFDRKAERNKHEIGEDEIVVAFVALGDFARKGLPLLLEGLKEENLGKSLFRLLVIGGNSREIGTYKKMATEQGLGEKVTFKGMQSDVRPFLWSSDLFALPSSYETFSLVSAQAAAAGLPILVTPLHGVEDYIDHGYNGWLVNRNSKSIGAVLQQISNGEYDLKQMGERAKMSIRPYKEENFRDKWRELYASLV